MAGNPPTELALLIQAQKTLLLGRIQFHRFGGGQSAHTRASRDPARRSLPSSSSSSAMVAMMLVTARPVGVLVSTPSRRDRTWTPRLVSSARAVATSRRSVRAGLRRRPRGDRLLGGNPCTPSSRVRCSQRDPTRCRRRFGRQRARRRDGVVLLIDGLLPGGHPEVCGDGHAPIEPARSDNSSGVRSTRTRTRL